MDIQRLKLLFYKILFINNIETAYLYYQSQKEAIKGIKDLIEKEKIDCCLKECTMSLYTDDLKNVGMLEKEQHYLHLFGETVFDNQKHLKTIRFLMGSILPSIREMLWRSSDLQERGNPHF